MADDDNAPLAAIELPESMPTARGFILPSPDGRGWIQVSFTRILPAPGSRSRHFDCSVTSPRNHEINHALADLARRKGLP